MVAILIIFMILVAGVETTQANETVWHQWLRAIHIAESSGQVGTDITGDHGESLGSLQIQKPYYLDAWGSDDNYLDVHNLIHARQTVLRFMARYCRDELTSVIKATSFNDVLPELETLSRVHNGGPRGHYKQATLKYWHKIERTMHLSFFSESQ